MSLRTFPQGLTLPLDASSVADGSVSDTEYQYLNGVTSSIQAQLDALSGVTPLTKYLASTVTYNNTAVLANTALSVTVASATKYAVNLVVHSTSAVQALLLDFAGTVTPANFIGTWLSTKSIPAGFLDTCSILGVTAMGTDFAVGQDGEPAIITFTGSLDVTTGGTFLLRGAQNVADASNTTILAGSTLILTPMS